MRGLERICWALGIVFLCAYAGIRMDGEAGRQRGILAFQAAYAETSLGTAGGLDYAALPEPDYSLWNKQRIDDYRKSLEAEVEPPRGILRIPALDLAAPIFPGTDELVLNRGIGLIDGTARLGTPGNIGLSAHRDGFFRVLKDISAGDEIIVQSPRGTLTYRVNETFVIDKMDDHVLDPTGTPTVTLVTCYPFYFVGHAPKRFIVRATLAEQSQQQTDPALAADELPGQAAGT